MGHGPLLQLGFLDDWTDRLRRAPGPPVVGVLLRGSHARGAATAYSDVDIDVLVSGGPYVAYPAYLAETGERLTHLSVAVRDVRSWLARLDQPADWSFGLPVVAPARLLWASDEWRQSIELTEIRQRPGDPDLENVVAGLGKVTAACAAGDEFGARFAAAELARRCPSIIRLANPSVTVPSRRAALSAALDLPVAPAGYRDDMVSCLGLRTDSLPRLHAAAGRLVAGAVALAGPYADDLAPLIGPELTAALRDGRLDRYVAQLARPGRPDADPGSPTPPHRSPAADQGRSAAGAVDPAEGREDHSIRDGWAAPAPRAKQSGTMPVPDLSPAARTAAPGPAADGPARPSALDPAIAARLRRNPDGLVTAVVRAYDSGDVLMVAWMDDEALHRTLSTGRATYWSRSRREYWVKGETSGHHQYVRAVALDCDGDALLVSVDQVGAACHTGSRTCFADELPVTGTGNLTAGTTS
ncbi:phosphoribosyl-AMP cyclohydrolase [Plantactinospora soyae]|uniref:Phosphoribosyl-AMP cyclohydrolase n=2 Tax=Plantactinospora soyae TaxID=1544732 RepID=A0A927MCY8_9ACTN|nr:phosphoribosyl-AMP cyclohydrolase [Plantactinospora soyae]